MDRSRVGRALDAIIDEEEGMRFQGLAVHLAQQHCPALIACERKKDLGLDAYASSATTGDGVGVGLICSITPEVGKIRSDAEKVQRHFPDVKTVYFATPHAVTNLRSSPWKKTIIEEFGLTLIPLTREEIITSLLRPENASLLADYLHLPTVTPAAANMEEVAPRVCKAATEVSTAWRRRTKITPLIELKAAIVKGETGEVSTVAGLSDLKRELDKNGRIVLEAPAGGGKTTTLSQLADLHSAAGGVSILVELPQWMDGDPSILDFVSKTQAFRALGIKPEELASVEKEIDFLFLINGLNEVGFDKLRQAATRLRQLEQEFPNAGIILATRVYQPSALPNMTLRSRLLPLDRAQRNEYLRRRSGDRAAALSKKIDSDPILQELTKTPLILSHVAMLDETEKGMELPETKMGILREVVRVHERQDNHRVALDSPPLSRMASTFLRRLSVRLTARGQILIGETDARDVIEEALRTLRQDGNPAEVLSELCAHHLLEPVEDPASSYRFVHQQFQEFFAAEYLIDRLTSLEIGGNATDAQTFAAVYLNEPAWSEPFYMVADEIGHALAKADSPELLKAGSALVDLSLRVDPVFAAELSHSCGAKVWAEVRGTISKRLHELWESQVPEFRECGLAGMIATGAPDFADILIPLLSGANRHTHYETYRAWSDFRVTSLGANWQALIAAWPEEARIDFVAEMFRFKRPQDAVVSFAFSDPSPRVRASAISGLTWFDEFRNNPEVIQNIDDESFREYLHHHPLEAVPFALEARALALYRERYQGATDPVEKLKIIRDMSRLGCPSAPVEMKAALASLTREQALSLEQRTLEPLLKELLDKDGPEWLSAWVLSRLLEGALHSDHWLPMVTRVGSDQIEQLLSQLESEDFTVVRHPGIIPILRSRVDNEMVQRIFGRIRELNGRVAAANHRNCETEVHIRTQLVEFLQSLALNVVVAGVLGAVNPVADLADIEIVTKLWGRCGNNDGRFRTELPDPLRDELKAYLQSSIALVVTAEDKFGELKSGLATALAQVGTAADVPSIEVLIRADIERIRRDHRVIRYTPWYLLAAQQLDENGAAELSIRFLNEPEYESDVAWSLVRLASIADLPPGVWMLGWGTGDREYKEIWAARGSGSCYGFDKVRRDRYARVLRQHAEDLWDRVSDPRTKNVAEARLKQLAGALAALDAHHSLDLILRILEIPMPKQASLDSQNRVVVSRLLQFAGVRLPASRIIELLSPLLDVPVGQWRSDHEKELIVMALALLPFLDDPVGGIGEASEWYRVHKAHYYPLRELVRALGNSKAKEALSLLVEILRNEKYARNFGDEWIKAVFTLDMPEAHELLLSFVDPALPGIPEANETGRDDILVSKLADIANGDANFRHRLFALSHVRLPDKRRKLLAEALAKIDDPEALISALNLVDDQVSGSLPYEVQQQIERAFVEHKSSQNSANMFTLSPRSANKLRLKLIQMAAGNGLGKESALSLLAQAEKWRLEYGRPPGELRNPLLNRGKQWPPATAEEIAALAGPTSRGGRVLILGKDTGDGLTRLRSVQTQLIALGYDAVLIKDQPEVRGESVIQKVLHYATSCRFVILDNTEASGHLYELPHVSKSAECITVVLQERGRGSTWMLEDAFFRHNHWRKFEFDSSELASVLEQAVAWAEDFKERFAEHQETVLPWLAKP
jgi:hypothetical protein